MEIYRSLSIVILHTRNTKLYFPLWLENETCDLINHDLVSLSNYSDHILKLSPQSLTGYSFQVDVK